MEELIFKNLSESFNPYFAGSSSGREMDISDPYGLRGFNPYFAGSSSGREN